MIFDMDRIFHNGQNSLPVVHVLASSPGKVELALDLARDICWFEGHFPGHPILPGVAQLDWVVRLARLHLRDVEAEATECQVKFRSVLTPDRPLTLTLELIAEKSRLGFTFVSGDRICSEGWMALAQ
jgi:3-hydroxymyristoyl/3-hydroxydecanoyl-(acyl carrier protein) dehydratase